MCVCVCLACVFLLRSPQSISSCAGSDQFECVWGMHIRSRMSFYLLPCRGPCGQVDNVWRWNAAKVDFHRHSLVPRLKMTLVSDATIIESDLACQTMSSACGQVRNTAVSQCPPTSAVPSPFPPRREIPTGCVHVQCGCIFIFPFCCCVYMFLSFLICLLVCFDRRWAP